VPKDAAITPRDPAAIKIAKLSLTPAAEIAEVSTTTTTTTLGPNLDDPWTIHQPSIKSMDEPSSISHGPIFLSAPAVIVFCIKQEFDILCLVDQLQLPINLLGRLGSPFTKKKNQWIIHIHAHDHPSMDIPGFDHQSRALTLSLSLCRKAWGGFKMAVRSM
jgi:hypothetical protein